MFMRVEKRSCLGSRDSWTMAPFTFRRPVHQHTNSESVSRTKPVLLSAVLSEPTKANCWRRSGRADPAKAVTLPEFCPRPMT
jgi:hypothetical protein